jgi:signal transduction histidine kinase
MVSGEAPEVVGLQARSGVISLVYRAGTRQPEYSYRRTGQSPSGRTTVAAASAIVRTMRAPAEGADRDLPLLRRLSAHRFTTAQLVAIDVAAVVLIAVTFGFLIPHRAPRASGIAWDAGGWVTYAVAAVATPFRRRFPRATLALVLPVAMAALYLRAGGGAVIYVVMALYSVAAVSSRRAALIIVGLVASAVLAATIIGGGDEVVMGAIAGVALVLLGWLAGENTRAGRIYAAQEAERAAEKAAAAAAERAEQVRRALADERTQIARELHDIVAHAMSVIAVRSGVARMVIDTDPQQAREALAIIETTTRRSLREMRLLVSVLRDTGDHHAELSPVPGLNDLGLLVADMAAAGVTVDVQVDGTVRDLSPAADLSAYRIVQEALTNVVRHAGPTRARVRISYRPAELCVEVTDEGPSGQPPPASRSGSGHGLIGMRERAALFGGELAAGPYGAGFRVKASLPTTGFPASDMPVSDGAR